MMPGNYEPSYPKLREHILNAPHFFAMLGVHKGSTAIEVREQRRKLAKVLHPDINGAPDAADLMALVNAATKTLTDERTLYLMRLKGFCCPACSGKGYRTKNVSFSKSVETICSTCKGSGKV
jgi:DnaJ-class molecular chaperone